KAVLDGRQGTTPARVVYAGGVVGVVEVDDELVARCAQVCALGGVPHVAARAVGLRAAGGVAEGDEDSARVVVQPVDGEAAVGPVDREPHPPDPAVREGGTLAGPRQVERRRLWICL